MKVSIISIGDELLIGQVVNTNASWMSQLLTENSFQVTEVLTVSDDGESIKDAVSRSFAKSDAVLMTGGLGPTKDDITKKVLCEIYGSELVEHRESLENVERILKNLGYGLTPVNRCQALVPRCCEVLLNRMGTAPGMWFEKDGRIVASMAGVPDEMQYLMKEYIVPRLLEKSHGGVILKKNILFQGIGESFLSDLVEPWELALPENVRVAYLPKAGMVKMRVTCYGSDREILENQLDETLKKLRSIAGEYIVGEDCETLAECVAMQMKKSGKTLSTAESCTGGTIAMQITQLAGASEYYRGGAVVYSNDMKEKMIGVRHSTLEKYGAVSEQTVVEMVEGVRSVTGSDYAVATTGIAGPGGGTPEKPVGTVWIGICSEHKTVTRKLSLGNNRLRTVERTVNNVFKELLNLVKEECGK